MHVKRISTSVPTSGSLVGGRNPQASRLWVRGRRRGGSLTLELLFVLPILMAVLLGTIEFSMFGLARQQLVAASREGARVAALGGTQGETIAAVQLFLGNGQLQNATIVTTLQDKSGNPIQSGSPVTVTVAVPATQAVPDLLAFLGISLVNENIIAQTTMRKE